MHVAAADHNWLLQFIVLAFAAIGFLYFLWDTASKSFVVDSNSSSNAAEFPPEIRNRDIMAAAVAGAAEGSDSCALCGFPTKKQCAGCKTVKYCSESCQTSHWKSEHKTRCKDLQSVSKAKHTTSTYGLRQRKSSVLYVGQSSKIIKRSNKILFPYEEFVQIFNWDKPGYAPCGLINCGNSCFVNAVLQCLGYTRPLVAYLLEKGHKKECQMGNWCFLCEFQTHVERASQSLTPFSPINILSRLHYIGGSFGYGEQEDAHEFMRYAIGAMQSVCLDEFGGEKVVHPSYQETTLIQHIFGGRLHSQVICSECNNVSDQFENMMDLTVEIHGDAGSLEECLEQFTAKEQLHGDNMYKCDDCNAYVMAWKRLSIQQAPNILTIALKRFKSGRYGKLNKRVTFPETLDLSSYTSNSEDGNDVYRLYAVIVHVDMLNASYFGHYICYVKDFRGNWYRIDDWQVESVDLDEVLSQGAYMLLYRRICARPSCLLPAEPLKKQENENLKMQVQDTSPMQPIECLSAAGCPDGPVDSGPLISANCSGVDSNHDGDLSSTVNAEDTRGDVDMVTCEAASTSFTDKSSVHTSLTDKSSVQENDVNENHGKKRDANEGSWSISTEESSGAKNCMFEESTSCTSMLDDDKAKGAAKNLSLESSRPKLKPIFRPGFLEKHPRKVVIKKEDRVSSAGPRERSPQNKRASAILIPVFAPGFLGRHPRKVISRNSIENEEGRQ